MILNIIYACHVNRFFVEHSESVRMVCFSRDPAMSQTRHPYVKGDPLAADRRDGKCRTQIPAAAYGLQPDRTSSKLSQGKVDPWNLGEEGKPQRLSAFNRPHLDGARSRRPVQTTGRSQSDCLTTQPGRYRSRFREAVEDLAPHASCGP